MSSYLKTSGSEATSSAAVQFRTINGTYHASFSSTGQFVLRLTGLSAPEIDAVFSVLSPRIPVYWFDTSGNFL